MRLILSFLLLAAVGFKAFSQEKAIPLYPDNIPNSKPAPAGYAETTNQTDWVWKVTQPRLIPYFPEKANGTAIVICPGGGYGGLAAGYEGKDVAQEFARIGVTAFVLLYRLPSDQIMVDRSIGPLQDAQMAILTIRRHAAEWHIDPAKIGIMGFSAGGHLASTAGTHFDRPVIDDKENISLRPDFMMLLYPVISFGKYTHNGSRENLIGKTPDEAQVDLYSNEKQVTANTPPTFLVHAEDDNVVPVQNSLQFYDALLANKVKAELHLFQEGGHGFGMNNKKNKGKWFEWGAAWLEENGFLTLPVRAGASIDPAIRQIPPIEMTYGSNSMIRYSLQTGTLQVLDHGTPVLYNIEAVVKANGRTYSSKDYTERKYRKENIQDNFGKGEKHMIVLSGPGLPAMNQIFYTYPGRQYFLTEVELTGEGLSSNYMAPVKGEFIQLDGDVRSIFMPFDNDTFISYNSIPFKSSAEVTSAEAGAVFDNDKSNGFVWGSVQHGAWKTGVKTMAGNGSGNQLTVWGGYTDENVNRDHIEHGKISGNNIRSPRVLVGYFADWRNGLEEYAKANRIADPPYVHNWTKATPVGWNSWGVLQDKISYDKAVDVVDFFADSLKGFRLGGTAYIDLDSYWDKMVNGEDYSQLKKFADYCKSRGLEPGVYWAPFTDWGDKNGPGRKVQGSNYSYGELWTRVGNGYHDLDGARAIDPTHPGTLRRIDHFTDIFKACGFKMIKIDFLGHAAIESTHFYDTTVTTGMEAYRKGMEYLVNKLGKDMLIYAAISPSLATGRYVHSRRIACDAFKTIEHTRYTLNSVTYGWWQTWLYNFVDADHVVLDHQSEGENRARFLSSLITGTVITGDDFSTHGQWSDKARLWYQDPAFLTVAKNGKAFLPLEGNTEKSASPVFYRHTGKSVYVAVFNYNAQPQDFRIDLERIGLPADASWEVTDLFSHKTTREKGYVEVKLTAANATLLKME